VPPAPLLNDITYTWDTTTPGYADVRFSVTFSHSAEFPAALIELWVGEFTGPYVLAGTMGSDDQWFTHVNAAAGEKDLNYKGRYVNGPVVGPFSDVLTVSLSL